MRTRRGTQGCLAAKAVLVTTTLLCLPFSCLWKPAQYWSRAERGRITGLGSLQGLVEVANLKLVMYRRGPSRACQVKVAQK